MDVKPAFSSALNGIQQGMRDLDQNAFKIAQATTGEGEVTQPLVESLVNKTQVQVNAKVVSIVDQALGTLFDAKA